MLLDKHGHLKLADFGTCMRMDKVGACNNYFTLIINILRWNPPGNSVILIFSGKNLVPE